MSVGAQETQATLDNEASAAGGSDHPAVTPSKAAARSERIKHRSDSVSVTVQERTIHGHMLAPDVGFRGRPVVTWHRNGATLGTIPPSSMAKPRPHGPRYRGYAGMAPTDQSPQGRQPRRAPGLSVGDGPSSMPQKGRGFGWKGRG